MFYISIIFALVWVAFAAQQLPNDDAAELVLDFISDEIAADTALGKYITRIEYDYFDDYSVIDIMVSPDPSLFPRNFTAIDAKFHAILRFGLRIRWTLDVNESEYLDGIGDPLVKSQGSCSSGLVLGSGPKRVLVTADHCFHTKLETSRKNRLSKLQVGIESSTGKDELADIVDMAVMELPSTEYTDNNLIDDTFAGPALDGRWKETHVKGCVSKIHVSRDKKITRATFGNVSIYLKGAKTRSMGKFLGVRRATGQVKYDRIKFKINGNPFYSGGLLFAAEGSDLIAIGIVSFRDRPKDGAEQEIIVYAAPLSYLTEEFQRLPPCVSTDDMELRGRK